MLKLRKPFSPKVQLHIRQNQLQRLWDKYVPAASEEYEQIQLVYLAERLGQQGKEPEQIRLLLHLILQNKRMQMNLVQYPVLVKIGREQMERRLRQIERYYAVQLKSCDFAMYRTVKQYFTLLEQAEEGSRRYKSWQESHQAIEAQRARYRQLSLFSEKLRERVEAHSVDRLRMLEREFVHSLSDNEYRTLAQELIWQEKPQLISYLNGCDEIRCEKIVGELEADGHMGRVLSLIPEQPAKEKLLAAANRLRQKEFCLFYHQVMNVKEIHPQMVLWKKGRKGMLRSIDVLEPEMLRQLWTQMEGMAGLLAQDTLRVQGKDAPGADGLRVPGADAPGQDTLRMPGMDVPGEGALRMPGMDAAGAGALQVPGTDVSGQDTSWMPGKAVWEQRILRILGKDVPGEDALRILEKDASGQSTPDLRTPEEGVGQDGQRDALLISGRDMQEQSTLTLRMQENHVPGQGTPRSAEQEASWQDTPGLPEQNALRQAMPRSAEQEAPWQDTAGSLEHRAPWQGTPGSSEQKAPEQVMPCLTEQKAPERELPRPAEQKALRQDTPGSPEQDARGQDSLRTPGKDIREHEALRAREKEFVYSLLEPEYQALAEKLIWQEKPELIEYLKVCKKDQCKEIVRALEKDTRMRKALLSIQKRSVRKKLVAVANKLEQKEFCLFYRQALDLKNLNPPIAIWKKTRTEMLQFIDELKPESLQRMWAQMEAAGPVKGVKHIFSEKMLRLQERYEKKAAGSVEEQILSIAEENHMEGLADFLETEKPDLPDDLYQVADHLDRELALRRETIGQQQAQAFEVYQDAYHQILKAEDLTALQKEHTARLVAQALRERCQEKLTGEEIENICVWSRTLLDYQEKAAKEQDKETADPADRQELIHVMEHVNRYMPGKKSGEGLLLEWKEQLPGNRNIQKLLRYIRELEEGQKETLFQYLADTVMIWQKASLSGQERSGRRKAAEPAQGNPAEAVERFMGDGGFEPGRKSAEQPDSRMPGIPYERLREWGDILLLHPDSRQEAADADLLTGSLQGLSADGEDAQTQMIRRQIELAKDRNSLQRLIRQVSHRAGRELVYADAKLRLPQVQTLITYIRQLDEAQYGVLVEELAQITGSTEQPGDEAGTKAAVYGGQGKSETQVPDHRTDGEAKAAMVHAGYEEAELVHAQEAPHAVTDIHAPGQERNRDFLAAAYPVLVQRIQAYESAYQKKLSGNIRRTEQKIFGNGYGVNGAAFYGKNGDTSGKIPYESGADIYEITPYGEAGPEYEMTAEEAGGTFAYAAQTRTQPESGYVTQELEYSAQRAEHSQEEQKKSELRMQMETAKIKSAQEQLDRKLKEVEHQLKKVETDTGEKRDVKSFAEEVKRQMYEELHVEKLRRGLV